jgi:CRISPR/Cas system CMR-associated protein Cmr5 small subunit
MRNFLEIKIKADLISITEETLKGIKNPDGRIFLENFYSKLKEVTLEEQWVELFMELSAIMYLDFRFTKEELVSIDKLLEVCERIAKTQVADTSYIN